MKNNENFIRKIMGASVALLIMASIPPAYALTASMGNGCDDENNYYITPALALCETHVYNIGGTQNPADDATRQLMAEVIGLKSTVITQQMYKQYEYLNATVRRLKTQLQKAVLSAKLEAAGSPKDEDSDGGNGGYGANNTLVGAKDCDAFVEEMDILECLQHNIAQMKSAMNRNDRASARRQLKIDLKIAATWLSDGNKVEVDSKDADCHDSNLKDKTKLNNCINDYNRKLNKTINDVKKDSRQGGTILRLG